MRTTCPIREEHGNLDSLKDPRENATHYPQYDGLYRLKLRTDPPPLNFQRAFEFDSFAPQNRYDVKRTDEDG